MTIRPVALLGVRIRRMVRSPWAGVALVLLALGVIGAATVRDYGLTIDEPGAVFLPKWHYDHVVYGKPFDRDIVSYDGTLLSFVAEGIYQAKQWLKRPSRYDFERTFSTDKRPVEEIIAGRTRVRHPLVFCTFLLTTAAAAGLVGLLCGKQWAWLAPLVLALFPRFWGDSFFNFKDVPFAALFTCATLYGAYLIAQFLSADARAAVDGAEHLEKPRTRAVWTRLILHSISFGILIGLLCGVRVGGFVVIGFLLFTHVAMRLFGGVVWRNALAVAACYTLMAAACFGVTILCYPSSWSDPLGWFSRALDALTQYPWGKSVLFEGRFVPAGQLPWYYLPKWILISVPVLWLVCATSGLIVLLERLRRRGATAPSTMQRAAVVLLLLQCFGIPVLVIGRGSTMYDGMRHNLFILPAMAVAATCFIAFLYRRLPGAAARAVACALLGLLCLPILWDMVRLHPYQYVYFNRAAGSLRGAQGRYETDYWGLSTREGIEWLNRHGDRSRPVVLGTPLSIIKPYAHPEWRFQALKDDPALAPHKPFYYLAMPKHAMQYRFPGATTIYAVERQGGTLTIVQRVE